jgi:hypothetical protein
MHVAALAATAVILTKSGVRVHAIPVDCDPTRPRLHMSLQALRPVAAALCVAGLMLSANTARAQGDAKPNEQQRPQAQDPAKDVEKNELEEAAAHLKGAAALPECVRIGQRILSLAWRDDLDTAFRHLELYDRFGCPGAHIQTSFRCLVVQQASSDPGGKDQEGLKKRAHACWISPLGPAPATPVAAAPAGTTNR